MAANNRTRILQESVTLFNNAGVATVSTNHICESLGISPGNLYFHFKNKEAIVRELFTQMCEETYSLWKAELKQEARPPMAFIDHSLEIFWKYRFFHREMYHLRRKDPVLARKWKTHMNKTVRLLHTAYGHWVKTGVMKKIEDPAEMRMISDLVLITSSSFLQFFESPEKPATRRSLRMGVDHILRLLLPYHTNEKQPVVVERLSS